ncbi:MAG: NADP(H)-dependent aldo-keto reductase [Gammaproteobacteria bacterium]|nr:NADP(H)-dependent aldo-keto reductase [Gammaproteobacteria bacterium]MDH5799402.1 NADP(H)-dependent aldo-keto reductase [Gammaproteobacteria bacterium]
MEYRKLGRTELKISAICLGTMTWGEQNSETEAQQQLDYAVEQGVNFMDTAEMYPVPPKQETYSLTEQFMGRWIKARNNRDQLILATKAAGRADWLPYLREGKNCFDKDNIESALNASLQRLQTDYIDLYQLHWPDRKTNFFGRLGYEHSTDDNSVPIEETLTVMAELVKSGKIRHYGLSNETPWGTMTFTALAEKMGLPRPVSIQNPYSLVNRTFEIGLSEVAHREDVGLLAYSPLGFGVLSGKYLNGARPPGARLTLFDRFDRYSSNNTEQAVANYVNIANQAGLDPAQMALAYVNSRSFVYSNIIGATNMEQLQANIASIDLKLSDEVLEKIEQVHRANPNPAP